MESLNIALAHCELRPGWRGCSKIKCYYDDDRIVTANVDHRVPELSNVIAREALRLDGLWAG